MKKLISVLFLLTLLFNGMFAATEFVFADELEIMAPAKGMVVLEGNTNEVLYSFNKDVLLPMASVTKIATAIVAIENCEDINKVVKVSDKAVGIEGTSIYLKHNEEIKYIDLLYGLILASGNDCAVALAEEVCGEDNFVELMNTFAVNIGAKNTRFCNPHGLDEDGHYSTAYDLAIITAYALKNPLFKEICSTQYYNILPTNIYQARYLKNKNKLLFVDENCVGVKTGFTDNAGRCLVNASEKNNMQVISVVLNCGPMFEECSRLTNIAFENYMVKEFVLPHNYVSTLPVIDGDVHEIGIATIKGFSKAILKSDENKYSVKYNLPNSILAPIEQNKKVGTVQVIFQDNVIYEEGLYAISASKNIDIKYALENIIQQWF